jgi:hypothetical protein
MDVGSRDLKLDESLGLNCAWYADILMTLTSGAPALAELAADLPADLPADMPADMPITGPDTPAAPSA